jgi:Ser/Thr protein kinase RdoA (MazF antagonist)
MLRDADAREVLHRYAAGVGRARLTGLGNAVGFSGAQLWRVEVDGMTWCLKAWPSDSLTTSRLAQIHRLMHIARDRGLRFVPAVLPSIRCIEWAQRLWDMQEWMPGVTDKHPTAARIKATCAALAELHHAWASEGHEANGCPAVRRRLEAHQQWVALCGAGWHPTAIGVNALDALAARAWPLLSRYMPELPTALTPWAECRVRVQPCLCDIWHAHVFYEDERVSGIIDFGSVKADHIAVDLARFLGSIAGDEEERWARGMQAYPSLTEDEWKLARVLDQTGTLVGLFNWLKWLYRDGRKYEQPALVAARLEKLVERVERNGN